MTPTDPVQESETMRMCGILRFRLTNEMTITKAYIVVFDQSRQDGDYGTYQTSRGLNAKWI